MEIEVPRVYKEGDCSRLDGASLPSHRLEFLNGRQCKFNQIHKIRLESLTADYIEDSIIMLSGDPLVAFKEWEGDLLRKYIKYPHKHPDILAYAALSRDDELAGILLGSIGFRAVINHLMVKPEFQGHGIGSLLLENAEQIALSKGVKRVVLTITAENNSADAAAGFYERKGYKKQPGEATFEKELRT